MVIRGGGHAAFEHLQQSDQTGLVHRFFVDVLPELVQGNQPVEQLAFLHRFDIAKQRLVEMMVGIDEAGQRQAIPTPDHLLRGVLERGGRLPGAQGHDRVILDEEIPVLKMAVCRIEGIELGDLGNQGPHAWPLSCGDSFLARANILIYFLKRKQTISMTGIAQGFRNYWQEIRLFQPNALWFFFGTFLTSIGISIFSLLFNLCLLEAGFDESVIGQVLSFGSIGTFLAALPAAYLAKRYNARHILTLSTLLAAVGFLLQAIYLEPNLLLGANLFAGGVLTVTRLIASPFFMRNSSVSERAHLFAFSMAVGVLAGILGNLLGGVLPGFFQFAGTSKLVSLQCSLVTGIGLSLIGIFPFSRIREPLGKQAISLGSLIRAQQKRTILKLVIPYALVGMGAGLVIPFLNLYFREVFHSTSEQIGLYFALLQAMMVLGFLSGPFFARRFGMIRTIVFSQLLSIPFMLVLALAPSLPLVIVAFLIRGTLMNMSGPIQNLFNMEHVDAANREVTNSFTTLAWNGSWALSSALGGMIIHRSSFSLSFYITIGLYLLSSGTYFFFFRHVERKAGF